MRFKTSLENFKKIPEKKGLFPLVLDIFADCETPISMYEKVINQEKYSFLFESAEKNDGNGRFSFFGFDPIKTIILNKGEALISGKKEKFQDPLKIIKKEIDNSSSKYAKNFFGGAVGYFSFEVSGYFEKYKFAKKDAEIPESIFMIPGVVFRFDHFSSKIELGIFLDLSKDREKEFEKAEKKAKKILSKIESPLKTKLVKVSEKNEFFYRENKEFEKKIAEAKKKIIDGEIFQVQISQRFTKETKEEAFSIYRKLRIKNPSPYMFFLNLGDFQIIGSSPETLIRLENKKILLRPIAGTRRRGKDEKEDLKLEKELLSNEKEIAEHAMLLDLARNDVGKVAKIGTVKVSRKFYIKKYSHVQHILSDVIGELEKGKDMFDVFRTGFPAGTLTGAPKIRATEIITELEEERRGIYGGAAGYFGFSGNMDFAIIIRTILLKRNKAWIQAAGGVVFDSTPKAENKECAKKASACLSVLG